MCERWAIEIGEVGGATGLNVKRRGKNVEKAKSLVCQGNFPESTALYPERICARTKVGQWRKGGPMFSANPEMPTAFGFTELRRAFSSSAAGLMIANLDGKVLHHNDAFARMLDRTPDEVANANILDLTHAEDLSRYRALLSDLLADNIPGFVIEKRYVRPDGSHVWVQNSVSLLDDSQTREPRIISISEDICRWKLAEQALKNQEHLAALGRLTSSIVHEIRNPLESAVNLIYLAKRSTSLDEVRKYLDVAGEEIEQAADIAARGLEFHRQATPPVVTDLTALLHSVLTLVKPQLSRSKIQLEYRYRSASIMLLCFPREIREILVNLISNSIDAMPRGGDLRIRIRSGLDWRTDRPGVRITICDTGLGMNPRTRKKIYEPFFSTKGAQGSGLGLWLVANIVDKHQGSIHVRSTSDSEATGTVFTLIFPDSGAEGKTSD